MGHCTCDATHDNKHSLHIPQEWHAEDRVERGAGVGIVTLQLLLAECHKLLRSSVWGAKMI